MKKTVKNLITWSPSHLITSQKSAFTLAEVLITLAIIGVVATMTIPTLMTSYKEKQTVSHLWRVYSTLSQAFKLAEAEHGSMATWGLKRTSAGIDPDTGENIYDHSAQSLIVQRITPYLKVSKYCKLNEICYPSASYLLSGEKTSSKDYTMVNESSSVPPEANFFLNDGTFIQIGHYSRSSKYVDVAVTLPYGERKLGKTRFFFNYSADKGMHPEGEDDTFNTYCNPANTTTNAGRSCTAWVIYNKNMDYLHCADKLSWDGAHSCKEAE